MNQRPDAAPRTAIPAGPEHVSQSDVSSADFASLLYEELKLAAKARMQAERACHTLSATALVHEAFIKLRKSGVQWSSADAFYFAASRAMWQILVDHARRRRRDPTRYGKSHAAPELLDELLVSASDAGVDVLMMDDHLGALERVDPMAHQIITLRFVAGLSAEQTAETLGIDRRTVTRRWNAGRAWLRERMQHHADARNPDSVS